MRSLAWLAIAAPLAASGQEVPGIDLGAPPAQPPPAGPQRGAPDAAKPSERPRSPSDIESALGSPADRDAALGDRVKAVQRKGFLKRGRFEFTGLVAPSLNDAFFQKYGFGARLAYNIEDSFAVGVRGTVFAQAATNYRIEGIKAFQSQILASQLYREAMLEGIWAPVYGKVAFLGRNIMHFDVYLLAGLGGAWSATSEAPRNEGWHIAADFGGGVRFYPFEWMAFNAGIRGTLYPDQRELGLPAAVQRVIVADIGFSVFFPFRFEYVYP